ncbi:MAG: protein kinase [Verrucomicrobia bacterium]|nr:protein kinase [Verrucomicrobiota bacterium]
MNESLRYAHYRVLQRPDGTPWRLGMGAMGMTYKARDERLNIDVALKLILPNKNADAAAQALFLREARSAARVRHAHVASVLYLGDTLDELFYAMEFVPGEPLQKLLAQRGKLEPRVALGLAAQIAQGLGAIHAEGIIHRDLKPGNIMLVPVRGPLPAGAEGWEVKIIDFGLARGLDGAMRDPHSPDHTTGFRGTVLYASPEQCQEWSDLDGRSDLYALGCVLWEMLLGGPPFRARTQREIMNMHVGRPAPIEQLLHLPPAIQNVVGRLLAKDREARYPNANVAAHAILAARGASVPGQVIEVIEPSAAPVSAPVVSAASPAGPAPSASPAATPSAPLDPPTTPPPGSRGTWLAEPVAPRPRWLAASIALLLVTAGGWVGWRVQSRSTTSVTTAPVAHRAEKSVAVLPFENLSDDRQSEFFASGVQDEILTDLARAADLKVISRSSVRHFAAGTARDLAKVGQSLDVAYVVEGSVRCIGDRVRVLVQLVDTREGGKTRWAERYDRALTDIFAIQSEIAAAVAGQLKVILTPAERAAMSVKPTTELRAWEVYLAAKELVFSSAAGRGTEGARVLREAEVLLGQAIARDPRFFHAHCLLAYVHDSLFWFGIDATPARLAQATAALDRAAELRPQAGELHLARAFHYYRAERDYAKAAAEIALANQLLPNDRAGFSLRGYIDRRQGRFDDAIRNLEKAAALGPREVVPAYDLAESYAAARRAGDFFGVMDRLQEWAPDEQRIPIQRAYGGHLMLLGEPEPLRALLAGYQRDRPQQFAEYAAHAFTLALLRRDAEAAAEAAASIREEFTVWNRRRLPRRYFDGVRHAFLGAKADAQAAFAEAQSVLERRLQSSPEDDRAWMALACVQAHRGRRDDALKSARRAMALLPLTRDALDGANHAAGYVEVLTLLGEKELAFAELEKLAEAPFVFDHGDLKLHPVWDSLRADPRFANLLERTKAR